MSDLVDGSDGSDGFGGSTGTPLETVRSWFAMFVRTMDDVDLDLLTLWAAHSHLLDVLYTTPRLVVDSPVHGSGKTTVLEHLERLCVHPVQMASISSPALMARVLDKGIRTILIDEADRSLSPDKPGVEELIAIINSGYKRGGTRPVLVQVKNDWEVREMSTFAPVALAGNSPNLPEDTRSRTIRVLLLPDLDGTIQESDWEEIDAEALLLGKELAEWAERVRDQVRVDRPPLPEGCSGRSRERWGPLKRVAAAAGGRWPEVADRLILRDLEGIEQDRIDGMTVQKPAVTLLHHLREIWHDEPFQQTEDLIRQLVNRWPLTWGANSPYGKALTAQRFGRMLASSYKVHSGKDSTGKRGYFRSTLAPVARRMGVPFRDPPSEPPKPSEPSEPSTPEPARAQLEIVPPIPDEPPCRICGSYKKLDDVGRCYACSHIPVDEETA